MSRPTFRVHSPAGPPSAPAVLRRFLTGLEGRAAPRGLPSPGPADVRAVEALLKGGPPTLEAAELAGRLAREVLRAAGEGPLRAVVEAATAGRDRVTPRWDRASGGLLWGGVVVKRFRHDAANQAVVLDAFEGRGWPPSVADPLPRRAGLNRKERLRETVRGLNRRLAAGTIRFLSGGSGGEIRWVAVG